MLTAKENLEAIINHGTPDRYSNQYEGIKLLFSPAFLFSPMVTKGGPDVVNGWGVTNSFPDNVPGPFPVHTPDKIVIQDIENWRDYVHAPSLEFTDEQWGIAQGMFDAVDGTKALKAAFVAPGLFEQCHHLGEMTRTLEHLVEYPDEMEDLIKYLTEYELKMAEDICNKLHPDAIFHHDDWGGQNTTFMSVGMFEDFYVEPYKEIYGYYHDHGVKYIFHHSDSYAATFVPAMIEMGIDVWQGCFSTNNLPELIKKYGDKISFMGGIENMLVDFDGWTEENCREVVRKTIDERGMNSFIPCIAQGGPGSVFPGVYKSLWDEIDKVNIEKFGFTQEQLDEARIPIDIMF